MPSGKMDIKNPPPTQGRSTPPLPPTQRTTDVSPPPGLPVWSSSSLIGQTARWLSHVIGAGLQGRRGDGVTVGGWGGGFLNFQLRR